MSFLQLPHNNWRKVIPKFVNKEDMVKLDHTIAKLYETEHVIPEKMLFLKPLN